MKIYLAGPLFTEAERMWLRNLKTELQGHGYEVIWPFELFDQKDTENWGHDAARKIMETDREALERCDLAVALLDGTQVDDGTAWELGYAYAKGIPAIGIRTDFRNAGDTATGKVNAMIAGSVPICASRRELVEWLTKNYPGVRK